MSLKEHIKSYSKQVSDEERRFKDLFSSRELNEAYRKYYSSRDDITWLEFLREETERKLREQDGD